MSTKETKLNAIQKFIEKAIEGGYGGEMTAEAPDYWVSYITSHYGADSCPYEILLDPEAWKAVGKVEGWCQEWSREIWSKEITAWNETQTDLPEWQLHMHRMIDALADEKTIEEALSEIV